MPLFVEAGDKRMSQLRLKKMSQMRLKKMSQMRLKKMSQMRLKKDGGGADEVVEEMYEDPDKRMSQLRLKKDVVWDPRWVKWVLNQTPLPCFFANPLLVLQRVYLSPLEVV